MRGLGQVQKMDIKKTEKTIIDFLKRVMNNYQSLNDIMRGTGISPNVLTKRLHELERKGIIKKIRAVVRHRTNKRKNLNTARPRGASPCHGYYLTNSPLAKETAHELRKKRSSNQRFHYTIKNVPLWLVKDSLIEIECFDDDKGFCLNQNRLSQRCYESKIKRSPVLTKIRKIIHEHKKEAKCVMKFPNDYRKMNHKKILKMLQEKIIK